MAHVHSAGYRLDHTGPLLALTVRVPTGFLFLCAVGYSLYLTGLDWTILLGVLDVILPGLVWLALRRWAPWPWVKSKWALVGLLGGGITIGLWLAVALKS